MNIDLETVKTVATWGIVGIAVVGLLLAIIVKKIVGKILSLVIAAVLIFFAWQQRSKVIDFAESVKGSACAASTSFFGVQVNLPQDWCKKS